MRLARLVAFGIALGVPVKAGAYEFHIASSSVGQGYQVRWLRLSERDRWLNRRRFTQSLRLDVWDILAPAYDPGYPDQLRRAPVDLYFTSSLRFDNDFGEYADGTITHDEAGVELRDAARTLVPELDQDTLQLDMPYAYLGGRRLGGWLDFRLGRQLEVQTFDWYSFDGLTLTAHTPFYLALEAHGGLVVRSSSLWGSSAHEPDGTEDADCRRVESGGSTWVASDRCAQRHALMPGFGVALESEGLRFVHARVAYRRAQSRTSDDFPVGTPAWGVNEEKLSGDLRGSFFAGSIEPFLAGRYDLVLGLVDDAEAGVRLALGNHALTPAAAYSYPSFDADSIFNVFASEPYTDLRLGYDVWPWRGHFRGFARTYVRRFEPTATAVGVTLGGQLAYQRGRARLDAFHDVGHGGVRVGTDLSGDAWIAPDLQLEGRLTLVAFDDELADLSGTTFGAQAGARWLLQEHVALHFIAEENSNHFDRSQFRLMAIMDFAFTPEI